MSRPITISRRERLRTATVAEIKALARRLLVDGGPQAISLRAIARDMGMTAGALYRYFPSLDALVLGLAEDLYDELREAIEAARDATDGPALERLGAMARALRAWSVANPAEFGLMFGNPVPGVARLDALCLTPDHPGPRFGAPWLAILTELWHEHPFPAPPRARLEAELGPSLGPFRVQQAPDAPIEVVYAFLAGWTRLWGLVAMEVFGQINWALDSVEPLFEVELATFLAQLSAA
jgi:AcrR family transcriptional regulator